jgi:uncharacterized protein (DUF305 family)
MSKYLAFSLMIIVLILGIMGGYFVAPKTTDESDSTSSMRKLIQDPGETGEQGLYTDQQFFSDMIAHHEEAVAMSKKVLLHTSRKEVRELANTIIDVQTKEISDMKQKLQEWQ